MRGHNRLAPHDKRGLVCKVVSGGQTGVDRAALDAALQNGIPAGGWCPESRRSEDGRIAEHYPLIELPGAGYRQRTKKNVIDSDGTLIICFGPPTGGTALTQRFCVDERKPYLMIDAVELPLEQAEQRVEIFLCTHKIAVLNVAGPRASTEPKGYVYTKQLLSRVLRFAAS